MKTKLVFGMVALATTMAFSSAHAAGGVKMEVLRDYSKQVKEVIFGKGQSAKGLNAQQAKVAQDKMLNELNLPGKNADLNIAIAADTARSAQRLDNLATIVAVKKVATSLEKTDAVEAKSINDAADAGAKLIANSSLIGASEAKILSKSEAAEVREALLKGETLIESMVMNFSKAERDSYSEIINKHDELLASGKMTAEDAFVQAIMDVKKVDKTKALEIVKKLKECV